MTIAFLVGRYTSPREPFYFIGTKIDPFSDRKRASSSQGEPDSVVESGSLSPNREQLATRLSDKVETLCGAPTKSGRPCRRKVRGGGYCWQHRDKFGKKQ